jgi:hypothetical protein
LLFLGMACIIVETLLNYRKKGIGMLDAHKP